MNNFMLNVKQLKMNKFIKYIWQLIITTSNATLEVPSLLPWMQPSVAGKDGSSRSRFKLLCALREELIKPNMQSRVQCPGG